MESVALDGAVGDTGHFANVDAHRINRTQAIGVGGLQRGECCGNKHATDRHSDLLWAAT